MSSARAPAAKKPKLFQTSVLRFADFKFTASQQDAAERKLALFQVMTSVPFSCLESHAMAEFLRCLRPEFQLPSRRTLQRRTYDVYMEVRSKVESLLQLEKNVALSIDGWEDHAHCACLGITVRSLRSNTKPFLLSMSRQEERQTGEHLKGHLISVIDHLKSLGCKTTCVIADGGANMQLALSGLTGVIALRCFAHSGLTCSICFLPLFTFFFHPQGAFIQRLVGSVAHYT